MSETNMKTFENRYKATDDQVKEEQMGRNKNRMMRRFQSVYDDIQDKIDSIEQKIDDHLNQFENVDVNEVIRLDVELDKLVSYADKIKLKFYPGLFEEKIR